jgi:hypothetical protein
MPEYSEFSEFSYGYALVDNLAHSGSMGGVTGAPRFISLLEEGSAGGGFDVALDFVAWPFFLQFKIPQIMRRRSEPPRGMPLGFRTPYYRMHLRTERVNSSGMTQHEQLMELEQNNPLSVFYVAPRFHTAEELDQNYLAQCVHDESEWFSLSGFDPVAPLSREPHRLAYGNAPGMCVIQSNPIPFTQRLRFNKVVQLLRLKLSAQEPTAPHLWVESIESAITASLSGRRDVRLDEFNHGLPNRSSSGARRYLSEGAKAEFRGRLRALARTVRTRLDAELFLAMPAVTLSPPA